MRRDDLITVRVPADVKRGIAELARYRRVSVSKLVVALMQRELMKEMEL